METFILNIFTMFIRINDLSFVHICVFKFFIAWPRSQYDIFARSTTNAELLANYGQILLLFTVVIYYTGIFNHTNDKLAGQRLLK